MSEDNKSKALLRHGVVQRIYNIYVTINRSLVLYINVNWQRRITPEARPIKLCEDAGVLVSYRLESAIMLSDNYLQGAAKNDPAPKMRLGNAWQFLRQILYACLAEFCSLTRCFLLLALRS